MIVEHQRLDQIVEMALVIRDVDDAAGAGGSRRVLDALGDAADLAENRVQRMLQGAIEPVALFGAELVEIAGDLLPRVFFGAVRHAAEELRHIVPREHRAREIVRFHRCKL